MADQAKFIWFNGKIIPWEDAQIHVMSHVIHYGSGVFEGIKCYETDYGPAVFKLKEHLERLHDSAAAFNMKIPFSPAQLFNATIDLIKSNNIKNLYIIGFYNYNFTGGNLKTTSFFWLKNRVISLIFDDFACKIRKKIKLNVFFDKKNIVFLSYHP